MKSDNASLNPTQKRILDTAEKVFVEKGYDGARVDEIAEKAQINKSQLYYYFGSKENILRELMRKNIREAEELVENSFDISRVISKQSFEEFVNDLFQFFKEKENIIRIIMIEMFKNQSSDFSIFEIFDPLYRKIKSSVKEFGMDSDDHKLPVSYFFLDIMPFMFFVTFADKFSEHYGISKAKLEEEFSSAYKETQIKYFQRLNAKKENMDFKKTSEGKKI